MFQMHGWKFKISKILNFRNSNLKTCSMPDKYSQYQFKWSNALRQTDNKSEKLLSVERQPQNLEFRNNPENFHQCKWPTGIYCIQHMGSPPPPPPPPDFPFCTNVLLKFKCIFQYFQERPDIISQINYLKVLIREVQTSRLKVDLKYIVQYTM